MDQERVQNEHEVHDEARRNSAEVIDKSAETSLFKGGEFLAHLSVFSR